MRYLRKTSDYLKRISLSDITHIMSIVDLVAIHVKTQQIYSGCSLEKVFIKLIQKNPIMVIYVVGNQVDSCHGCVCGSLT